MKMKEKWIGVIFKSHAETFTFPFINKERKGKISSTDNSFQTDYAVQGDLLWNVSSAKVEFGTNSYGTWGEVYKYKKKYTALLQKHI